MCWAQLRWLKVEPHGGGSGINGGFHPIPSDVQGTLLLIQLVMRFPPCCFPVTAWCTSISIMASFPKTTWDILLWRQDDLQLQELPFLVSWKLSFFIRHWNPACMYSFDSFSLPKRCYFCLRNTTKLEPVGNFSGRYLDVATASCLSETAVLCTLHGCVNADLAPFPAFTTQSWLTAGSVGGILKCELSGMPVMWSLHGGPTGDRTLLRFHLLMEQWRPLHVFVTVGGWCWVSWMQPQHSAESAEETSPSKKNDMGEA